MAITKNNTRMLDGTIGASQLDDTLDLSAKTVTLPAASVTAHSGTPVSGAPIQIQTSTSTAESSKSGTDYVDLADMTATITPTATTSKIMIQVSFGLIGAESSTDALHIKLLRDTTEVGNGTNGTINTFMSLQTGSAVNWEGASHLVIDTPASTSAITYKLQWATSGTSSTWYLNRRGNDSYARTASTFTLTEIAG
nr:uncharacterized protein [uncultured Mediterranean phage uvMED]